MQKQADMVFVAKKSLWERGLHAVLFEVTAILISAPLLVGVMGISLSAAGMLTIFVSLAAMLWNVIFNMAFDRVLRRLQLVRDLKLRIAHAMAFELGLLLMVVPMAAWWLDISLLQAFVLDIGLILFFLPYTLVFNWVYDVVRDMLVRRGMLASL
ncbi:multidrug/biocide efflux PACE transporter [Undibacterium sp.]|uniref:multidrug/biocide efflux PACE transporter n=1 Tax=Undibacterium sp. TaxID=1914977 RepID=UPI00374D0F80